MCCGICGSELHTTGDHRGVDMEAKFDYEQQLVEQKRLELRALEDS